MAGAAPEADAKRFQCDTCGAEFAFNATSGQLLCAHCGSKKPVPDSGGRVVERDLHGDLHGDLASLPRGLGTDVKVHRCQDCGANVSFPAGTTATRCTFCGSSKILDQSENTNAIRPESLVPFAIDKKAANKVFSKWLGKLWFRPGDLKKLAAVQEVNGVYVPFWTYDAEVDSSWTAERGTYFYVEEMVTEIENGLSVTKSKRVQQTQWEQAWGKRHDTYDDELVCASKGLPDHLSDKLATFKTAELRPYAPGYLAGWRAEEYAIDLRAAWETAKDRIESQQKDRCAKDVGGDTQRGLSVDHRFSEETYKHVLLPVWIAAYRYHNRVFRFLVNGQTGEVVGTAPFSATKITLFVFAMILLLFVLVNVL